MKNLLMARYRTPEKIKNQIAKYKAWYYKSKGKVFEKIRNGRSEEELIKDIQDPNAWTRVLAAETIGMTKDVRAIEPLIAALEDQEWFVRKASVRALRKIGTPTVELLSQSLANPKEEIRESVARALGKIADEQAVEPLIRTLEDEKWKVRKAAVQALGQIGDTRAAEPLIHTLKDGYWSPRKSIADALGKLTNAQDITLFVESLQDEDWFIRKAALNVLKRRGLPAVKALIQAFGKTSGTERKEIAKALGKMGIAALKPLFQTLLHKKQKGRKGGLETFDAIEISEGNTETREDWIVRETAAKALGKIGDVHAVQQLILALRDTNWPAMGTASVAGALGEIKDVRAIAPLIDALGRKYWVIQRSATKALQNIGKPALEPLMQALEHENGLIRKRIVTPLSKVCALIETVVFGDITFEEVNPLTTWHNPDVSKLPVPLSKLERIIIDPETYNFHALERFITYAVNYIRQKHLRKHVIVHIYGEVRKLHPNLYNALNNLCKTVEHG